MTPYFQEQLGCEGSMSQHDTLEPCPFCGALPDDRDVGDYFVSCPSCGIDGPAGLRDGREAAANAWNRRAALSATQPAQAAQGETKRCEHCDDTGDVTSIDGHWRGYCTCQHGKAAQGEPTLKPEQVVEAFNLHFPNTRMAQAYIGFATDLWALGVKAQRAWQSAAGADVQLLDAMERHRIAVVPEFEGTWDASVYGDEGEPQFIGSGDTPRDAIRAAIAAIGRQS